MQKEEKNSPSLPRAMASLGKACRSGRLRFSLDVESTVPKIVAFFFACSSEWVSGSRQF